MATMTVYVNKSLKGRMDARNNVKWSEVFRRGISKRLEQLENMG